MRRRDYRLIGPWRPATKEDVVATLGPAQKAVLSTDQLRASQLRILVKAAMGFTHAEIAKDMGYSPTRVGQIINSPAAQDRIAQLSKEIAEKEIDRELDRESAHREAADRTALLASNMLYDQLVEAETAGAFVPYRDLHRLIMDRQDRYGTPKKSTNVNLNANFGTELEEAIARSEAVEAVKGATISLPQTYRRH